ncbi:hypothetical protein SUGI_1223750 [Cryptomeria japonica]|uniref:Uncharacterized protein n=1 Tax=Cryptomeria japonica TaxID=3369 RepID=A0AAD3NRR1_CRYJA|nr:hypothetical protein SUGI_1223750 [Cryptomeria japonica]
MAHLCYRYWPPALSICNWKGFLGLEGSGVGFEPVGEFGLEQAMEPEGMLIRKLSLSRMLVMLVAMPLPYRYRFDDVLTGARQSHRIVGGAFRWCRLTCAGRPYYL